MSFLREELVTGLTSQKGTEGPFLSQCRLRSHQGTFHKGHASKSTSMQTPLLWLFHATKSLKRLCSARYQTSNSRKGLFIHLTPEGLGLKVKSFTTQQGSVGQFLLPQQATCYQSSDCPQEIGEWGQAGALCTILHVLTHVQTTFGKFTLSTVEN